MPVAGEGPQPALGMIVGEAPGKNDEKAGRPFTGRPGRRLDTALRALGLTREELYVTNVVKDLPLNEEGRIRVPTEEEVAEWLPILAGEIERTAPAAILALGRTATNALTSRIFDVTGDIPYGSVIGHIVVAAHPAQVIGNRHWLAQLEPFARMIER